MIVYEGYEESTLDQSLDDESSPRENDPKGAMRDDLQNGESCSYDADASNDSIELNLSLHEETDSRISNNHHPSNLNHQQCSNHLTNVKHLQVMNSTSTTTETICEESDKIGRGSTPFIPISEETIFLDTDHMDPVASSGASTMSSPMSCDSWMNYSSNSSDDLSCISDRIHDQHDSSEESSLECDTSIVCAQSTPKLKRNFDSGLLNPSSAECSNNYDKERRKIVVPKSKPKSVSNMANALADEDLDGGHSKRLRGKSSSSTVGTGSSMNNSIKRKTVHRNNSISNAICDIRMIDFAHTTFVRKNIDMPLSSTLATIKHQGPDNGFLRGIESLKRLLNEILNDVECE